MPDKDDIESPYTTIHMHKTTKDRIQKIKGRGLSWDRFLNEHFPPEQKRNENENEKVEPQVLGF